MSAAVEPRAQRVVSLLALALALGLAAGWFLGTAQALTFASIQKFISPIGASALCLHALASRSSRAHWAVPLLLTVVLLDLAYRPHHNLLGAIGLVAGVLGMIAALCRARVLAMAATAICGVAVTASLYAVF